MRRRLLAGAFTIWTIGIFLAGLAVGHWAFIRWVPRSSPDVALSVTSVLPELDAIADGPIRVPDVIGLRRAEAIEAFTDVGLLPDIVNVEPIPWVGPRNVVVSQDPTAGTRDPAAATLLVSQPTVVPDVVGESQDSATAALEALGARVQSQRRYEPGARAGQVLAVAPPPGDPASPEITITVAASPAAVFLSELSATSSECYTDGVAIDATEYPNSVACSVAPDRPRSIEYTLNRRVDRFEATVGQDDTATSGARLRFRVLGDGSELTSVDVPFGTSRSLDVDTRGVLRLRLEVSLLGDSDEYGFEGVWGDARLLGSSDAIQRLLDQ